METERLRKDEKKRWLESNAEKTEVEKWEKRIQDINDCICTIADKELPTKKKEHPCELPT